MVVSRNKYLTYFDNPGDPANPQHQGVYYRTDHGLQFITLHTGVITYGQFAGDTAVEEITGPTINLADCLHPPGITNRTSVVALQITRTT